jgi:hypothetical protein
VVRLVVRAIVLLQVTALEAIVLRTVDAEVALVAAVEALAAFQAVEAARSVLALRSWKEKNETKSASEHETGD